MKIVVLGRGVAGISSAFSLAEKGYDVVLIGKRKGASFISPWNILVRDEKKLKDEMLKTGKEMNDPFLLKEFVENFWRVFEFFEKLGIKLRRSNLGKIPCLRGGKILEKAEKEIEKNSGKIVDEEIVGVRVSDEKITSVILRGEREVEGDVFVLAIGGYANLFPFSTYFTPTCLHPILFYAGIKYGNLAYNMFHPFLIVEKGYPRTLISGEILMHSSFVDENDREFLSEEVRNALRENKWHYIFPKMVREFFFHSLYGKTYMKIEMTEKEFSEYVEKNEFGWIFRGKKYKPGMKIEVHPAFHYSIGGIKVDENFRSSFENTYAIGEATTGLHGSNRIGGLAVAEGIVFGSLLPEKMEEEKRKENGRAYLAGEITEEARRFAWNNLGIVKREKVLREFLFSPTSFLKEERQEVVAFLLEMTKQSFFSPKSECNYFVS